MINRIYLRSKLEKGSKGSNLQYIKRILEQCELGKRVYLRKTRERVGVLIDSSQTLLKDQSIITTIFLLLLSHD